MNKMISNTYETNLVKKLKKWQIDWTEIQKITEGDFHIAKSIIKRHFEHFCPHDTDLFKKLFDALTTSNLSLPEILKILKKMRHLAKLTHFLEYLLEKQEQINKNPPITDHQLPDQNNPQNQLCGNLS
ncbi:MAG: hypothetical protein NZO16_07715 [Deltaproteobacteria bacterium]|nr:hypothetical protein [Deltaproteobacteria bacterium]